MERSELGKNEAEKKEVKNSGEKGTSEKSTVEKSASEKGKESNSKMKKAAAIVIIIAVAVGLVGILSYIQHMGKKITVVTTVGNVTFTDKHREDDKYYVTFQAADYNVIPTELNQKGMTVLIEEELYKALPLKVEYDSVNVVFEVPRFAYTKAGFNEEQANVQKLWTEEILSKYARMQSVIWSMKY